MKIKKSFVTVCLISSVVCITAFNLLSPLTSHAKSIELSFALNVPPKTSAYSKALLPWTQEITKQTDGRVKFKFYLSQTLLKARDAYNGVKMGVADLTWVAFSMTPGQFPLMSVLALPFMSPDTYIGSHVLSDLYQMFPEMRAEVNDVHPLFLWVSLPYEIHTNKPVRTPEDIRGMKLATLPGATEALEALGAVPVSMAGPKIYQAVEKGVADGAVIAWGAYNAYRLYEVTKYHINAHIAGLPYCVVMNKKKWNSLSKQDQDIITKVTSEMMPDLLCRAVTDTAKMAIEKSKKRGQEVVDLSADELAKWREKGKPVWKKWVKQMDAKGLPGQKVLDETIKLVKKYRK